MCVHSMMGKNRAIQGQKPGLVPCQKEAPLTLETVPDGPDRWISNPYVVRRVLLMLRTDLKKADGYLPTLKSWEPRNTTSRPETSKNTSRPKAHSYVWSTMRQKKGTE